MGAVGLSQATVASVWYCMLGRKDARVKHGHLMEQNICYVQQKVNMALYLGRHVKALLELWGMTGFKSPTLSLEKWKLDCRKCPQLCVVIKII